MRYYVHKAELCSMVKVTRLRKLMMMGSKSSTEFSKKPQFEIKTKDGFVVEVDFYNPVDLGLPSETFVLGQNKISLEKWDRIMASTEDYHAINVEYLEDVKLRKLISALEEACLAHGRNLDKLKLRLLDSPKEVLYKSGNVVTEARRALYKELCLD